jgi:hypothetical protein
MLLEKDEVRGSKEDWLFLLFAVCCLLLLLLCVDPVLAIIFTFSLSVFTSVHPVCLFVRTRLHLPSVSRSGATKGVRRPSGTPRYWQVLMDG